MQNNITFAKYTVDPLLAFLRELKIFYSMAKQQFTSIIIYSFNRQSCHEIKKDPSKPRRVKETYLYDLLHKAFSLIDRNTTEFNEIENIN